MSAVIKFVLKSDTLDKAKTTATQFKDTGLKASQTKATWDAASGQAGSAVISKTRTINFVDKVTYPTISVDTENDKPWTNTEARIAAKFTGSVKADYTLFSDNTIEIEFTLTTTMTAPTVLALANVKSMRICTSPFSWDGTSTAKSLCADMAYALNSASKAEVKAGQYEAALLNDAIKTTNTASCLNTATG